MTSPPLAEGAPTQAAPTPAAAYASPRKVLLATLLLCLSGRGDKDLETLLARLLPNESIEKERA